MSRIEDEYGRRYDLVTPCKNCPFRSDESAIRFACRERAEEIEESAYRNGFPCHLSAEYVESDDYDDDGYFFREGTQHCVGYIIMRLKGGETCWPGLLNDEDLVAKISERVDWSAPVFEDDEEFLAANEGGLRGEKDQGATDRG